MPDQPELRQRLAEIVDEHWPSGGGNFCEGCGWSLDRTFWKGERTSGWANHVVQALLALPGIAITPVPKPESTTTDIDGDGLKTAQFPHDITAWSGEYPGVMDCDADMSIEVARSLAASLLAAANFAEAGVAEEQTNA